MAPRGPNEGKGTGVAPQGIPSHPLLVSSMKLIKGNGQGATHRVSRKQEDATATRDNLSGPKRLSALAHQEPQKYTALRILNTQAHLHLLIVETQTLLKQPFRILHGNGTPLEASWDCLNLQESKVKPPLYPTNPSIPTPQLKC